MSDKQQNAKDYFLKTPLDFLNVPDDKIDECLTDFKSWIMFGKKLRELTDKVLGENCAGVKIKEEFHWIDDGIRDGVVNVKVNIVN